MANVQWQTRFFATLRMTKITTLPCSGPLDMAPSTSSMILLPVAFPCEAASGLFFYGNNFLDSILVSNPLCLLS